MELSHLSVVRMRAEMGGADLSLGSRKRIKRYVQSFLPVFLLL